MAKIGQVCLPCNGNKFYVGNPDGVKCAKLTGFVNNKSSGLLPIGEAITDKTYETSGAIELEIDGKKYPLIKNIEEYGQCNLSTQIEMSVGVAKPPVPLNHSPTGRSNQRVPIGQYSSARMPGQMGTIRPGDEMNALDVMSEMSQQFSVPPKNSNYKITLIEVLAQYGPPPNGEGAKDIDSLTPAEQQWLGAVVAGYLKDIGGVAVEVTDKLASGNNWKFLKEMGFKSMRFWTNHKGTLLVAFRGNNKLRALLTATNYGAAGMAGKKISLIESAFRTTGENAKAGAKSIGSKAGVIGMLFVTVVDIGEYMADPSTEKEISDLFVDLGFDIAIGAVSAIVGTIVAGFAIAFMGALGAPVTLVVVGVIAVSVVIGYFIGKTVEATGAREALKEAIKNTESKNIITDDLRKAMANYA